MDLEKFGTAGDLQELLSVREEIEHLLARSSAHPITPKVDLLDLGDAFRVLVEVPGVPRDNLEIALQGDVLTVAGLREERNGPGIVFAERPQGHFQRDVPLPEPVTREGVQAHLEHGLLVVHLPKAEPEA